MTLYGEVVRTEWLTPGMVRIVLGGEGLAGFEPSPCTDQYVNALFVPDGAPYSVPFDVDATKDLPAEQRPKGRRYTIRSWDGDAGLLAIDFVAHGDVGFAGRWASRAAAGDRLQIVGPSGGYAPDRDADWYLMVGDESALPAIGASLEQVPADREAVVVVVVDDEAHELPLTSPGSLRVHWVHRDRHRHTDGPEALVDAVARAAFPEGEPDVFVHGEAAEVRAVRRHLHAVRGIGGASISPYWRRGHDDEQWREVKQAWLAESAKDLVEP